MDARDRAAISIAVEHASIESCVSAPATYLVDDASAFLRGECVHFALLQRLLLNSVDEEAQDVCLSSELVEDSGVHGVSHEHVGADADGDFVISLAVEAESLGLGPA